MAYIKRVDFKDQTSFTSAEVRAQLENVNSVHVTGNKIKASGPSVPDLYTFSQGGSEDMLEQIEKIQFTDTIDQAQLVNLLETTLNDMKRPGFTHQEYWEPLLHSEIRDLEASIQKTVDAELKAEQDKIAAKGVPIPSEAFIDAAVSKMGVAFEKEGRELLVKIILGNEVSKKDIDGVGDTVMKYAGDYDLEDVVIEAIQDVAKSSLFDIKENTLTPASSEDKTVMPSGSQANDGVSLDVNGPPMPRVDAEQVDTTKPTNKFGNIDVSGIETEDIFPGDNKSSSNVPRSSQGPHGRV